MTALLLATAVLLQAPVNGSTGTLKTMRSDTIEAHGAVPRVTEIRSTAPALPFGEDKVQHFLMSYAIASFTYGAARASGLDRDAALTGAMTTTVVAGAAKELIDRRTGGHPSFADFFADVLGAAAAYIMLSQVR